VTEQKEEPNKKTTKTPLHFRAEPWLKEEIEVYMINNACNLTEAIHGLYRELLGFKTTFESNPYKTLMDYLKDHPKTVKS
jgi:hypothetical protein